MIFTTGSLLIRVLDVFSRILTSPPSRNRLKQRYSKCPMTIQQFALENCPLMDDLPTSTNNIRKWWCSTANYYVTRVQPIPPTIHQSIGKPPACSRESPRHRSLAPRARGQTALPAINVRRISWGFDLEKWWCFWRFSVDSTEISMDVLQ